MKTKPRSSQKSVLALDRLFLSHKESAKLLARHMGEGGERELVAAHVFDLRLKAGLSQRELAEKATVGFRTLQRVEVDPSYSPSLDVLVRISTALNVPVERFFKKTDIKKLYGL